MRTKNLILCAVFAAILCVFSVMTLPIGAVPVTLSVFAVMLTGIILGGTRTAVSVAVYILVGAVGLPVFSGFKGGIGVLIGPTGGYIWSYIAMGFIVGFISEKLTKKKLISIPISFFACVAGLAVCYTAGTLQFMVVQQMTLQKSLTLCVYPFIVFDLIKAAMAVSVGWCVKAGLIKAKLL